MMDKLQYDLKAITKDYQKAFRELISVNKENLKNSDIKHQVNLLKKKYRGIKRSFKNYEEKQIKIQNKIKQFNQEVMSTRLIDIIKQEIGYANKNLTEYMRKSVIQAINPKYKGGNEVLAEKIRNNLQIDEKTGKVSVRKEVELRNSKTFEYLQKQFQNLQITSKLADSVINAIKKRGKEWQSEVENEIPKYKRKELLEKLSSIIDKNKFVLSNKSKEHVIEQLDKIKNRKLDFEDALFEATNEYEDLKTQLAIYEKQLIDKQDYINKNHLYPIYNKIGQNISQQHYDEYEQIKIKYKNIQKQLKPENFFSITETTSKALQKFKTIRSSQNMFYQEDILKIRSIILHEKYISTFDKQQATKYAQEKSKCFSGPTYEYFYQQKIQQITQSTEKHKQQRARKAHQ
jgi:predicted nucleic acid-binding protein